MKLRIFFLIGSFLFVNFANGEFSYKNDCFIDSDGAGLVYVFATGPDLFEPSRVRRRGRFIYHSPWRKQARSDYAKKVVDSLQNCIHRDLPRAQTIHLDTFTWEALNEVYSILRDQDAVVKRVILLIVAHGGISHETFYLWTDSGELYDQALLQIIRDTPTETALFTCNSGAVDIDEFPGAVFGASLEHTPMEAAHFYAWAEFIEAEQERLFPLSAKEIYDTWLESRIHTETSKSLGEDFFNAVRQKAEAFADSCWGKSHPFFYAAQKNQE